MLRNLVDTLATLVEIELAKRLQREWGAPRPRRKPARRGANREALLETMRQNGTLRVRDESRRTGRAASLIGRDLTRLMEQGLVQRVSRGYYRLTPTEKQ